MKASFDFKALEKKLYSAAIADILDEYGIRNNVMYQKIAPLSQDMVIMGRAYTVLATDVYEVPEEPYKKELEAVDSVGSDELIVATTNGSESCGFWGELLSTHAMQHGCRGAIIDGLTRDKRQIIEMNFPLFVRGASSYDSKGRTDVIAHQCPIICGGVRVIPGDIIFADLDGVVVVPQDIAEEVIEKALAKVEAEDTVREEIRKGTRSMTDIYDEYQIL